MAIAGGALRRLGTGGNPALIDEGRADVFGDVDHLTGCDPDIDRGEVDRLGAGVLHLHGGLRSGGVGYVMRA
jgi:hypothetical protein